MTTPVFQSGQGGTIQVASNTFNVTNWRLTPSAEAFDTTNTASLNYMGHDASGPMGVSGSADAWYDSANIPVAPGGLNIQPGQTAILTLNIGNTGQSWSFKGRFTETPMENPAKGLVTFNCSFVSTGSITFP